MSSKNLCVIPARANSARIPKKNLVKLNGISLVKLAYQSAVDADIFEHIVVSTDEEEMADGLPFVRRPSEISKATSDISQATLDALTQCENMYSTEYEFIATLQPATPLRTGKVIRNLYEKIISESCAGGVTGVEIVPWIWSECQGAAKNGWSPKPYPRSQEFVNERFWQEINCVQFAPRHVVLSEKRWDFPLAIQLLPSYCIIDIDEPKDFERAKILYPALKALLDNDDFNESFVVKSVNGATSIEG